MKGWNLLDGDVPLPALVLRRDELRSNVATMAEWCRSAGVHLAPHGKTTMAPAIFDLQMRAGAWGMTAATPAHARLYRHFGIPKILYANQLVEPQVIEWFAAEIERDPEFDLVTLVDSSEGAKLLARELGRAGLTRQVDVLVEIGEHGGRTGARTVEKAVGTAMAVVDEPCLRLVGVEGFEGLIRSASLEQEVPRVTNFLERVAEIVEVFDGENLFADTDAVVISVGGSAFFDLVADHLRGMSLRGRRPVSVVLRSGAYVTQDGGAYNELSPLGQRAAGKQPRLHNAIEVWSAVLSRPEPDLVILGMGKRDVPHDLAPPTPVLAHRLGNPSPRQLRGAVVALTDQHAHVRIDTADSLTVGDLVGSTISHPCTALDRWRLIPVVDAKYHLVDAIHTFF